MKYNVGERLACLADRDGVIQFTGNMGNNFSENFYLCSAPIIAKNLEKQRYLLHIDNELNGAIYKSFQIYEDDFHLGPNFDERVWWVSEDSSLGIIGAGCCKCGKQFTEVLRNFDVDPRGQFVCWSCQL